MRALKANENPAQSVTVISFQAQSDFHGRFAYHHYFVVLPA